MLRLSHRRALRWEFDANELYLEHSAHMRPITHSKATSLRVWGKTLEVLEVVASGVQLELQRRLLSIIPGTSQREMGFLTEHGEDTYL